jgi:uncharacterized protein
VASTRIQGRGSKGKRGGRATASRKPQSRSPRAKPSRYISFVTLSLAAVGLALAAIIGGFYAQSRAAASIAPAAEAPILPAASTPEAPSLEAQNVPTTTPSPVASSPAARPPSSAVPLPEAGAFRPASYRPEPKRLPPPRAKSLVFIIDDAGYSLKQLEAFLGLPFPLTIAVLPGLPNSEKAARAVLAAGKELILHQPMQALGGQDPGPGALILGMSPAEVERIVEANLRTVPGAAGMNNHMGSATTTDLGIMEAVAEVAKRRGIYYLDSLTTSGTAVAAAARREGIPYWERDVFLDNAPDRASIIRAVEDGKKLAAKDRPAVMIGHVWSAELAQALTDLYPQLVAEGFSLSTISRFMVQEAEEDDASIGD